MMEMETGSVTEQDSDPQSCSHCNRFDSFLVTLS